MNQTELAEIKTLCHGYEMLQAPELAECIKELLAYCTALEAQ